MDRTASTFTQPRTDEEIMAEIDRLFVAIERQGRETRAILDRIERKQERADRELTQLEKRLGII